MWWPCCVMHNFRLLRGSTPLLCTTDSPMVCLSSLCVCATYGHACKCVCHCVCHCQCLMFTSYLAHLATGHGSIDTDTLSDSDSDACVWVWASQWLWWQLTVTVWWWPFSLPTALSIYMCWLWHTTTDTTTDKKFKELRIKSVHKQLEYNKGLFVCRVLSNDIYIYMYTHTPSFTNF